MTLIELLMTLAIAAILAALAAPSIRDFIVRSKMTNVANEFSGSVLRARSEAVNRNICTVMCMSSSAGDATPQCTSAGEDWQQGWIVFLNPTCDSSVNKPKAIDLIVARTSVDSSILLNTQSKTKKIPFDARGNPPLSSAGRFSMIYDSVGNDMTKKYGVDICLDSLGRTRIIPGDKECSQY